MKLKHRHLTECLPRIVPCAISLSTTKYAEKLEFRHKIVYANWLFRMTLRENPHNSLQIALHACPLLEDRCHILGNIREQTYKTFSRLLIHSHRVILKEIMYCIGRGK